MKGLGVDIEDLCLFGLAMFSKEHGSSSGLTHWDRDPGRKGL